MALSLRKQKLDYLSLMEKYELEENHRFEFMMLISKMRKIREFEVDDIIKILFEKIQNRTLHRAKDLRTLGKIFLRSANEDDIHRFLKTKDMTFSELEQRTVQSGFSLHIENAINEIATKMKEGIAFTSKEKEALRHLFALLKKAI